MAGECHLCGCDPEVLVLLPPSKKYPKEAVLSCVSCALRHGVYCQMHQVPHTGFGDDTTACLRCVNEKAAECESFGEELLRTVRAQISLEEREELEDWLDRVSWITEATEELSLMRVVVARAFRSHVPIEAIERRILEEKSIRILDF